MVKTLANVAIELLQDEGLSSRTRDRYESILRPFLSTLGRYDIKAITREQVEGYLKNLGVSSHRTHQLHQRVIARLFNFAVEQGYIQFNPVTRIRKRKPLKERGESVTDERVEYLTQEQLTLLFKTAQYDTRLSTLLLVLYESGARIGEVLSLDKEDVDLNARTFDVVGKGNKRRRCYFGEQTKQALEYYVRYSRWDNLNPFSEPEKSLFTHKPPDSSRVVRLSYQRAFADLKDAISPYKQLETFTFHQLRHTFATERAAIMPIEVLRALLGHTNIQTTLIYQQVTSRLALKTAHEAISELEKNYKFNASY